MIALEGLEGRSLFSATLTALPDLAPVAPVPFQAFGSNVVTKGSLALVASQTTGSVTLYDTSTNTTLGTYVDPNDADGSLGYGFGFAMTFFGSGNSFAISAPQDGGGGKVFVYMNGSSVPTTVITAEASIGYDFLTWTDAGIVPFFGQSLAGYGDNLLIATDMDANAGSAGHVQLVDPVSGTELPGGDFQNPEGVTFNDHFGDRMAVNGDQILFYAMVGGGTGLGQGVVYHFDGSDFRNDQGQLRKLTDPVRDDQHLFGQTIVFDGDNIVVSAPQNDPFIDGDAGGPVYQFSASTDSLVRSYAQPSYVPTFAGAPWTGWGFGLAVSGNTLVISSPLALNGAQNDFGGRTYAYDLTTGNALLDAAGNPLQTVGSQAGNSNYGFALAGLPDGQFLVADPTFNGAVDGSGAVHRFQITTDQPTQTTPPTAAAGDDQTAVVGTTVTFSGADSTAAGGATITSYEWDFDYDGTNFDSDATGVDASFVYTATGAHTVALKVTDSHGKTDIDTLVVTVVLPPAPTADAGLDESGTAGAAVALHGSSDTAGVTYAWDFDYDGVTFDDNADGADASAVYTSTGAHAVALRVTDAYGQSTIDTAVVTVAAQAPTADAGAAQTVQTGDTVAFHATATAGLGSTVAGVAWDFSYDGNTFNADATGANTSHVFAAAGTYVVAVQVTDADGQSTVDTTLVTVTTPAPPPPVAVVNGNLVVTAPATSAGLFTFAKAANGGITVSSGGTTYGPFSPTGSIVITGSPLGNLIIVPSDVTNPVEFYGGAGTDIVQGGAGNDILVGGGGVDVLSGGLGRNVLIGGGGSDVLVGSSNDDILIAGSTSFDNNPAALQQILAEWTSSRSYTDRVNNLRNQKPSADRLNGSTFLIADSTVFDDGSVDILSGNSGQDWFLFNNDKGILDIATDVQKKEVVSDLDLLPH